MSREDHMFFDKTVVFTGPLESMSRIKAMEKVVAIGGKIGSSVTRKTNYIVTGICNLSKLSFDKKSSKLRKAEMLIQKDRI